MADLFILAMLGHLVGDYLLQTKQMALRKSEQTWEGIFFCCVHVLIYTIAVCALVNNFNPIVMALIFVPHWLIDHWSLADKWLGFIKGRTFKAAIESRSEYREFDVAFTSIVYTVVDNTFHVICLWLVIQFVIL